LIQGNDSAAGKDQHGYYKGPEVEFLAGPTWMRAIGRLSASMKTLQQQGALFRVGASTEKRGRKFRGSNDQIGVYGHENCFWFLVHSAKVTAMNYTSRKYLPRMNSVLR
jgi:hypothetical protein